MEIIDLWRRRSTTAGADDRAMDAANRRLQMTPPPRRLPRPLELRLQRTSVAWLSTAGPDGMPALVPVWFLWRDGAFVIFSKPRARKVENIALNPHVVLAIGDPTDDFDVQLVEGDAELVTLPVDDAWPQILRKYRRWLGRIGLGQPEFAQTYRQAIRVTPTRFLPWRGRTWLADGRPNGLGALAGAGFMSAAA